MLEEKFEKYIIDFIKSTNKTDYFSRNLCCNFLSSFNIDVSSLLTNNDKTLFSNNMQRWNMGTMTIDDIIKNNYKLSFVLTGTLYCLDNMPENVKIFINIWLDLFDSQKSLPIEIIKKYPYNKLLQIHFMLFVRQFIDTHNNNIMITINKFLDETGCIDRIDSTFIENPNIKFGSMRINNDMFNDIDRYSKIICDLQNTLSMSKNNDIHNNLKNQHISNLHNITIYKKKTIPKTVKNILWKKYFGSESTGICVCYETNEISILHFEAGHIQSEKNGGTYELNNLKPVCSLCNKSIGTSNMDEFMKTFGLNTQKISHDIDEQNDFSLVKIIVNKKNVSNVAKNMSINIDTPEKIIFVLKSKKKDELKKILINMNIKIKTKYTKSDMINEIIENS